MTLLRQHIWYLKYLTFLSIIFLLLLGKESISSVPIIGAAHAESAAPKMKIFFIEVGGGSASLIILPNGKTLLIDGGTFATGGEVVEELLRNQGITSVNTVVATHVHRDHMGGISRIIENFSVGEALDPDIIVTTPTYDEYLSAINAAGVQHRGVRDGDQISLDPSVKIEIFNPPKSIPLGLDATHEDVSFINNYSVVIKVSYGDFAALFPGDILPAAQAQLVDKDLDVNVLLAPHHGSANAQNLEFLTAASPEVVVVIPGAEKDETPTPETVQKLEFVGAQEIINTQREGTTILETDGHEYTLQSTISGRTIVLPEFTNAQIILVVSAAMIILPLMYARRYNPLHVK
jgi:beta-lactamase superfamily II metal-dependent hydrolase